MPERILIARRPSLSLDPPEPPEPYRSRRRLIVGGGVLAVVIVVLAITVTFVMRRHNGGSSASEAVAAGLTAEGRPAGASAPTAEPTSVAESRTAATPTTAPPATAPATTVAVAASGAEAPITTAPAGTGPPPTRPDGSWPPIIGTFDANEVTLTGSVPSRAASDRLEVLAAANSKTKVPVKNNTTIDPRTPADVGVRVVELTSARFPAGSVDILPQHAAELNRVVNVMKSLPNVTVLVIGHADQRGTSDKNFAISLARAQAVVDYFVAHGVDADRLSSKAVGADEPLTQGTSGAAYALNRRTEFVFYGMLVGA
jgi:outer membrane protein OmpA-like peptidoglycan-associated protein